MVEQTSGKRSQLVVDPPARIVILGGGPIGIETGLYARYLGYHVTILERGAVAENLQRWGHVQLSNPFAQVSSPLGLAALMAQYPDHPLPAADQLLTGREWAQRYVIPLARTDLLADCCRTETTVVTVRRTDRDVDQPTLDSDVATPRFVVHAQDAARREIDQPADVVIDTSGVYGHADGCGRDGQPVPGERELAERIEYGIPDVLGAARAGYESKRTLVVGDTIWATMTLLGLSQLVEQTPATRVTWLTSDALKKPDTSTSTRKTSSPPPRRQKLARIANRLVCKATTNMTYQPGSCVQSLAYDPTARQFLVTTSEDQAPQRFDRLIVNSGFHRDTSLFGNLRPDLRLPGDHPTRAREGSPSASSIVDEPTETEPHFYVLGAKSLGRDSQFVFAQGLDQIRDLFAILGGRDDLDLYATA
jgi:hypothetical protein